MTHSEKILKLLADHDWHSFRELNQIAYRYSARIHELRQQGYAFEIRSLNGVNFYRLKEEQ